MRTTMRWVVGSLCLLILCSGLAIAQEETADEPFAAEISGRKTWTLRYGMGSPLGLATDGIMPGQLDLDQSLTVDLRGEALSVLTIEAHFDDRLSDNLQSLSLYLDTDHLDGVLGDFTVSGIGPFSSSQRKMKGLRLDYTLDNLTITGVLSRFEGMSESRTFVGLTASDTQLFLAGPADPERPWEARPYAQQLEGLHAYPLEVRYVEEFSDVLLSLDVGAPLRADLQSFGLDYLYDTLASQPGEILNENAFTVLGEDEQILLLLNDWAPLLKAQIKDAIKAYNKENDLSGSDAKKYPFVAGSETERAFTDRLADKAFLSIDGEVHPLTDSERSRFYDTGHADLVDRSVNVFLSTDGDTFLPVSHPEYAGVEVKPSLEEGIVELVGVDPAFFALPEAAIRISFTYAVTGGTYMLGLSLIPNSERVMVNDQPLERDIDYMIDYEIGLLVLLVEVGEDDVIRIDYERFGSGFGGASDYARYFGGIVFDWPVSDVLSLEAYGLRAFDNPSSMSDPESARTMPNRQTVIGVSGAVALDGFTGRFDIDASEDRFPEGDNARRPDANEVAALAAGPDYLLIGHANGLSVHHDETWRSYGVSDGLGGRDVHAIALADDTAYVGTNAGLTVVSLEGASPLDRTGNWTRFYEEDGLPSGSVESLWIDEDVLWVGTEAGWAAIPLDTLDERETWAVYNEPAHLDLGPIRAVTRDRETLALGTDDGLYLFYPDTGDIVLVAGTAGMVVHDLFPADGLLYAATDRGVRVLQDGIASGWLAFGTEVFALALLGEDVYLGTGDGLASTVDGPVAHEGWKIAALASDEETGLWVGSRAAVDYTLMLWHHTETGVIAYDNSITTIAGEHPSRYFDIPADEHTAEGVSVRASFDRKDDDYTLAGSVDVVTPGYHTIGSSQGGDRVEWEISGAVQPFSWMKAKASHVYRITDLTAGAPRTRWVSDVSLSGSIGPDYSVSLALEGAETDALHAGLESSVRSFRLSLDDTLFNEALALVLTWQDATTDNREYGTVRRDTRLAAGAELAVSPDLWLEADWNRPIWFRDDQERGRVEWTAGAHWSHGFSFADVDIDYGYDRTQQLPSLSVDTDHTAEVSLDINSWTVALWQIVPNAGATLDWGDGAADLSLKGSLRGTLDKLTLRATLTQSLTGLGETVRRTDTRLSGSANYTGWENLRPSINYVLNHRRTIYEGVGTLSTMTHSLSGRVTYTSDQGLSDTLALSLQISRDREEERELRATLDNTFQLGLTENLRTWFGGTPETIPNDAEGEAVAAAIETSPYPNATLRVNNAGELRSDADGIDASLTTACSLDLALTSMWGGAFSVSHSMGVKGESDPYHSLLFELTLSIDF